MKNNWWSWCTYIHLQQKKRCFFLLHGSSFYYQNIEINGSLSEGGSLSASYRKRGLTPKKTTSIDPARRERSRTGLKKVFAPATTKWRAHLYVDILWPNLDQIVWGLHWKRGKWPNRKKSIFLKWMLLWSDSNFLQCILGGCLYDHTHPIWAPNSQRPFS